MSDMKIPTIKITWADNLQPLFIYLVKDGKTFNITKDLHNHVNGYLSLIRRGIVGGLKKVYSMETKEDILNNVKRCLYTLDCAGLLYYDKKSNKYDLKTYDF